MKLVINNSLDDLEGICSLFKSMEELQYVFPLATYPLTLDQFEILLNKRSDFTTIINDSGKIIAFGCLYNIVESKECFIGNVVVSRDYRKNGLGRILVNRLVHICRAKYSVENINIICRDENIEAIQFYNRLEFEKIECIIKEVDAKTVTCSLLRRKISSKYRIRCTKL